MVDGPRIPFTHRSDMWSAGVVVLELYAGGLSALRAGRGENVSDALEAFVRDAAGVTTKPNAENGGLAEKKVERDGVSNVSVKDGKSPQPGAADKMEKCATRGKSCTKKQDKFRVDMPEGVLEVLREIFQWEAGDRPASLEVRHVSY